HKLTALPVTDDDNQLLGIITESDIFGYLIEMQTPPR
ncbi:MAG: CBS domain-containing protein, partial [Anaerolineales bacterium]|nr:CBS domain-containing protein [Anaerolineales bacterium]